MIDYFLPPLSIATCGLSRTGMWRVLLKGKICRRAGEFGERNDGGQHDNNHIGYRRKIPKFARFGVMECVILRSTERLKQH